MVTTRPRLITWKRVGIAFLLLCLISGDYWVFILWAFGYGIFKGIKADSVGSAVRRPPDEPVDDSILLPLAIGYYAGHHHDARHSHEERSQHPTEHCARA